MISTNTATQPGPFWGPGCVVGNSQCGGFGFRTAVDVPRNEPGVVARIGLKLSAFALAAGSTLGIMQLGYDAPVAAGVTISAAVIADRLVDRKGSADRRRSSRLAAALAQQVYPSPLPEAAGELGAAN